MSEYWVSKKRYFCKYCKVYIADDAPSRQHHEGGLRHKGNLEKFIRGIYKAGEKQAKDAAEEAREMARIEQVAQAAFAQDVGAGLARHSTSTSSSTPRAAPSKSTSNSGDRYSNYSTAASLGFTDPDAEREAAEQERKRKEGTVGEWQVVESALSTVPPVDETEPAEGETQDESVAIGVKRALTEDDETREFKLRKKSLGTGLGEIYDPGKITIPLKIKKQEPKDGELESAPMPTESTTLPKSGPKWIKKEWASAAPEDLPPEFDPTALASEAELKQEDASTNEEKPAPTTKVQEDAPTLPAPSLFKKRRPAGQRPTGRREP